MLDPVNQTPEPICASTESDTLAFGAWLAGQVKPGDVVTLEGPLGSGKTTLVRGFLAALGHEGHVRSPSFNLMHAYRTTPPVLHADLYRLTTVVGLGLEEYLADHVVLVEWPEIARETLAELPGVSVVIEFDEAGGRRIFWAKRA